MIDMKLKIEEAFNALPTSLRRIRKKMESIVRKLGFTGTVNLIRTDVDQIFYIELSQNGITKRYRLGDFVVKKYQQERKQEPTFYAITQHGEQYTYYQMGTRGFLIQINGPTPLTASSNIQNIVQDYINGVNTGFVVYEISRVFNGELRITYNKKYSDSLLDVDDIDFGSFARTFNNIRNDFGI